MNSKRKIAAGIATTAVAVIAMGGTASANHAHFVVIENPHTGVTTCQYVASGQSEPAPKHPLHTIVHTGTPGTDDRGNDFDKDANESARCGDPGDVVRGG